MKVIEGFHIKKVMRGTKKGQDFLYKKKYMWKIPERIEEQISKGDIVLVHSKDGDKDIKGRVLVENVLEGDYEALRSVIDIVK
ncbi:DUF5839 family protein [Clostridium sp.]|uniref:DUF5839 family protein n=1 Tax=Clostridium sp. TaxID=1506 RepID=UPI002FCBC25D